MLVVFVSALFYGCCVCISSLSAGGVCSITQLSPSQGGGRGGGGQKTGLGGGGGVYLTSGYWGNLSVLREWILENREVKSEMKILFTHFEK